MCSVGRLRKLRSFPIGYAAIFNFKIINKFCANCLYNCEHKRYFIIDQQIAEHFVHYSKYLSKPLPFYATEMINPFFNSRISANHNKELGF